MFHTINKEFDFFKGERGSFPRGEGGFYSYIYISIIFGKHMEMMCFKFNQNRTINEKFNFFEKGGRGRGPFEGKGGHYS